MTVVAAALALGLVAPRALAGNVHSTPDNGKEHVHKLHNPLPKKHKATVGLTRDQKFMDKHPGGREPPAHSFSKHEQKVHELHVHNGLLHKKDPVTGHLTPYDTGGSQARFVMKPSGRIIADHRLHTETGAPIVHPSLSRHKRVAAAGMMKVDQGRLTEINNSTGHFQATPHHHTQVVHELRCRGVRAFRSVTGDYPGGSRQSTNVD